MKVLLISQGSTGDIYPLIGLGRALLAADHSVSFASAPLYKDEIEDAGIDFLHTPPDWQKPVFVECMRELDRQSNPIALLQQIYRSGLSFMGSLIDQVEAYIQDHDLVVCSYVFPHFKKLCERHHVPFATIAFCHSVIPSDHLTPELLPSLRGLPKPLQIVWNRLAWKLINYSVDRAVNKVSAPTLATRGLPPVKDFILKPSELSIVSVSRHLMQTQRLDARFQFTGYVRWQAPENENIADELIKFCAGDQVPILTFGSVSFDHVQAVMSRFEQNWPLGHKIIIQSGWAGLSVELSRPEIKVIQTVVSHDQLFQFASCVIHHGGAGTTASAFHAGVPQIVVPHFGDQSFWANEVQRLGLGLRLAQNKWPERLPNAVKKVLKKPHMHKKAAKFAELLRQESGAENAVVCLESYVLRHRSSESV